jgi:hypothetical protein
MKYIANPVEVDAFKIVKIVEENERFGLVLELEGLAANVLATKEMMSRMTPVAGDYWVIQSDGYIYLNPKEVFERKYSLKPDQAISA